jgi:hypothetical protein
MEKQTLVKRSSCTENEKIKSSICDGIKARMPKPITYSTIQVGACLADVMDIDPKK